jgi:hypothetical protein
VPRGLSGTTIDTQWDTRLSLNQRLVLPDFTDPTGMKKVWPPHEVPLAVQLARNLRQHRQLVCATTPCLFSDPREDGLIASSSSAR